ncbi:MAG: glycosyltransferase [Myxococcota bacterium]|nr:glycosyltransferase [Myxococcota bacterium]
MPFFTIVLPTRNRADLVLNSALPTILNQTFGDFEVVVCDNFSSDDTQERVEALGDPRVRY